MSKLKKFGVLFVVVFAFSAVAVANASAAPEFTASAAGTLSGTQTSNQVFTTNGGTVTCTKASTTGNVATTALEQEVTVNYSGCTAFGFASVTISPATYNLHANGTVDILNTITISVPLGGCTVTVGPQKGKGTVTYTNGTSDITESSNVTGIVYTTTGGICGSGGSNGVYKGSNTVTRVGGGFLKWDA
jgi:hypothetical protein